MFHWMSAPIMCSCHEMPRLGETHDRRTNCNRVRVDWDSFNPAGPKIEPIDQSPGFQREATTIFEVFAAATRAWRIPTSRLKMAEVPPLIRSWRQENG